MANENEETAGKQIALGVCGGIAAYKAVEILRGLQRAGYVVRVAMTARACEFITPLTFRALSGHHVIVDDYAADNPDPIAHITYSQSVDLLLIAPATANILAKFANGIADDFLTSTYLASTAPVLVAPAMNTTMWNHPATQRNLERLRIDGVSIIEPDAGEMACGTIGPGRLSEPDRIVSRALEILSESDRHRVQDLKGERILITAGATREDIDPVRFLSNHSSGRMGFALASAASSRGADVTVIAGETSAQVPVNVKVTRAASAEQMNTEVTREIDGATVFIAAAAVSDYRPAKIAIEKIKKSDSPISLELEPTPDILAGVSAARHNGLLVFGFAAESNNLVENARRKLISKRVDLIVANDIGRKDAGFNVDTNVITLLSRLDAEPEELPLMTKSDAAHRILDEIVRFRENKKSQ